MDREMEKGKKEAMDPIMMEEEQIRKIMETFGKTRSQRPYHYNMNNKKRVISDKPMKKR
jgi:hypothetical protein